MGGGLRFNCGEFVPGGQPVTIPGLPPPTTVIIIPKPPQSDPPFEIIKPPKFPRDPRRPGGGRPPGPGFGGTSVNPSAGGSGIVVNPSGPSTGGPSVGTTTGGTTGSPQRYRCKEVEFFCPDGTLRIIKRFCSVCTQILDPELLTLFWPVGCIHLTKPACELVCKDSNILSDCISLTQVVNQIPEQVQEPNLTTTVIPPSVVQEPGSIGATTVVQTEPPIIVVNVSREIFSQPLPPSSIASEPRLFDPELNFFNVEPDPVTVLVPNLSYPNIFAPSITIEVSQLIQSQNSSQPWSESTVFGLTLDKVKASLNPQLLAAFNSFHYPGGQLIGLPSFLEMVRKHILTGTLDELDAAYYIGISQKQRNDVRIRYEGITTPEHGERAGLGILASQAILIDTDGKEENHQTRQLRRQRRLNEDVRVKLTLENGSIPLTNAGLIVQDISGNCENMTTGDGDGYYINYSTIDSGVVPLLTQNEASSTYYVSPEARYNALTLFGVSPDPTLGVTSQSGSHEFVSGDTGASSLEPLYFELVLSSISSLDNNNPLVDTLFATYQLLTDQTLIDEHSKNNGFAVTRANLDYRDPMYRYAQESSAITIQQNDITFRALKDSRSPEDRAIFARNVPFGIVVTPVMGSKFNPFNGFSRVTSFGDTVSRSLEFSPSFQFSDDEERSSELQEVNLYNESGDIKVGVFEPVDTQNYTYKFDPLATNMANTYFVDGAYGSAAPAVSANGIGYLTQVVDTLYSTYEPEEVTWFDVFRRLTVNKLGELFYNTSKSFLKDLEKGNRNEMKINHVIGGKLDRLDQILVDDDNVVITVAGRKNAVNR